MAFAILATFRLGYYQGRNSSGSPEQYPTPLRLHAALTASAFGLAGDNELSPQESIALRWLEKNPPDAVVLPESQPSWRNARIAYREKSLVGGKKGLPSASKKNPEDASRLSALNGAVEWWWENVPYAETAVILDALCFETPYLGEVSSPVQLSTTIQAEIPDLALPRLDQAPPSAAAMPTFDIATPGRLSELEMTFRENNPAKLPTEAKDRYTTSESEELASFPRLHLAQATYDNSLLHQEFVPWDTGYLFPVKKYDGDTSWPPRPQDLVAWSVALHRALVKFIGLGASPLVTGKYPKNGLVPIPANRCAIQPILPGLPINPEIAEKIPEGGFLLMVPSNASEADPHDLEQLDSAIGNVHSVFQRNLGRVGLGKPHNVTLREFWVPPTSGFQRWWQPMPFMISESRAPRRKDGSRQWTAIDAVALSLGHVWRQQAAEALEGDLSYANLAQGVIDGVIDQDLRIVGARRVHPHSLGDYIHKAHPDNLVTALTAEIRLPKLLPDSSVAAIGQSRHLGGGLLYPIDKPAFFDQVDQEK